MDIRSILKESIAFRCPNVNDFHSAAIRLVAGVSDGLEGVLVEQFGAFVLVTIYNPDLIKRGEIILKELDDLLPEKSILVKLRQDIHSNEFIYLHNERYKNDDVFVCYENNFKFEIHTDPRHDYGLYLDTKAAREMVSQISANKNVLNLFSYTCAFGVAAMLGGAKSVTNVDPCKEYLSWGGRNAELNSVQYKRYPDTTQDYLKRHLRRLDAGKDLKYDLIIVDPPAFLVGRGSNRLARNMWPIWFDCLKKSRCFEFIIVINDKTLGRSKDLYSFLIDGLGDDIEIKLVSQSFDILGMQDTKISDTYYFNPLVFYIRR